MLKKNTLKILLPVILFLCIAPYTHSQSADSTGNAYVFRLIPSAKNNVSGIAFGLAGSESVCKPVSTKKSHGLNLQVFGQGIFIPLNHKVFSYRTVFASPDSWMLKDKEAIRFKALHNGLLMSSLGTMTDVSNGAVFSAGFSLGYRLNGIAFNLFASKYAYMNGLSIALSNESYLAKGVQIGIVNRAVKLKGFQFGLWNVNEKRKLPLINWSFW